MQLFQGKKCIIIGINQKISAELVLTRQDKIIMNEDKKFAKLYTTI